MPLTSLRREHVWLSAWEKTCHHQLSWLGGDRHVKNVPVDRKQKHPWLAGHRKPPLAVPKTSAALVQGPWQGLSIAAAVGRDESVVGIACAAGPMESMLTSL